MINRALLIAILACLTFGCIQRLNQSYEELSQDAFFTQSGGYGYIRSSTESHPTVFPKVIQYAFNDEYILIMQDPDSINLRSMVAGEINTGSEKFSDLLEIADSLIANDPFYKEVLERDTNYWIIDNKARNLIGPMSHDEFLEQYQLLNIPKDLILENRK